ncbi:MAG: diguanylate cyclase [Gammaproteobacteria bacterium]|nr:diguanylate cyclase [Gammaproteobacteria bacterium]MDH5629405.1 diguanylate cyclase [Gammaproteobacteria bacterium]
MGIVRDGLLADKSAVLLHTERFKQQSETISEAITLFTSTGYQHYENKYLKIIGNAGTNRELFLNQQILNHAHAITNDGIHQAYYQRLAEISLSQFEIEKLNEVEFYFIQLVKMNNKFYNSHLVDFQKNRIDLLEILKQMHESDDYKTAEEKQNLSVNEFSQSISKRVNARISYIDYEISRFERITYAVAIVLIVLVFIQYWYINEYVLKPIAQITKEIKKLPKNNTDNLPIKISNDEVGLMIKSFYNMRKKMLRDYFAVKNLALKDPLTDIYNRRAFFELTDYIYETSVRNKKNFTLAIFDIDHFKMINDQYGHSIGDKVLIDMTKLVKTRLRKSDVFARFGGEEFIIVFPNATLDIASKIISELKSILESHKSTEHKISITISAGIAQVLNCLSLKEMIEKADQAMYQAKTRGRNRIVIDQS